MQGEHEAESGRLSEPKKKNLGSCRKIQANQHTCVNLLNEINMIYIMII
jgi:hypothetical protein